MKLLDRYIASTLIGSTAFVALILIGIQNFLLLVDQFRHVGVGQYTFAKAVLYVLMQMPAEFYQLFPMAGFLGCLIGLGRLASSSQLIVMRASGISIARITGSVLKAAVPLIVLVSLIGEGLGPLWQQQAFGIKQKAMHSNQQAGLKSIWIRKGNTFTHISRISKKNIISGITRYNFNKDGQLKKATYAKIGRLDSTGQWTLSDLSHTLFLKNKIESTKEKTEQVNLLLQPNLQLQMTVSPSEQSLLQLYHAIKYRFSIGLSANQLIYTFWQRALQPLTSLIMICLGVPFVFGSLRSASMGMKVLLGVVVGFAFYMLNQLFGPITLVYQYPPFFAAMTPTIIFTFVLICLLSRVR